MRPATGHGNFVCYSERIDVCQMIELLTGSGARTALSLFGEVLFACGCCQLGTNALRCLLLIWPMTSLL
jgi:hypothetical protein